ncbi:MAG: PLP-dependent transferase [Pseudomonadales bacterium]|jgi:cystathionine gamma-synthase
MNFETIAIQAGRELDEEFGAVMPPIHMSSTFHRGNANDLFYSRINNPNRHSLETCLTALEGGDSAMAFASGMAAISAVFQSLSSGDHIILPDDIYFGVKELTASVFSRWGLEYSLVDMTNLEAVKANIRSNTSLIWAETPSNPLLKITDIRAISEIAKNAKLLFGVDATWATPLLQRPLELGADLVVHSSTKYLGGHSDLIGGIVIVKDEPEFEERIRTIQKIAGAVPSPFDCWLLLRGIRTLAYRMRGHCANAKAIAERLSQHPQVHTVHYPGLFSHPGYEIAARQMSDFGGMLSIQVVGGAEQAAAVASGTKLFTEATSLGGVESLIEHRAVVEGPDSTTPDDLLRISVGLEHVDDLIEDLLIALERR